MFKSCAHITEVPVGILDFVDLREATGPRFIALCPACTDATRRALSSVIGLQHIFPRVKAETIPAQQITKDGEYILHHYVQSDGPRQLVYIEFVEVRNGYIDRFANGRTPVSELHPNIEAEGPII